MRHGLPAAALALATAALALGGGAGAAQADSIAYVKDGNVWLSTSDGARQHQVTATGGYTSVSQDDAGLMIALNGTRLHWLERDGRVKADILTPVSAGPQDGRQWFGPFDPKLSPDGTKVAYHWYYKHYGYNPYCNAGAGCVEWYMRQGTGYTRPDRLTSFEDETHKAMTGWIYPTWVDGSSTVVLSDPSPSFRNEDLVIHTPYPFSGTDGLTRWADERDVQLHDGEFDPTRRKMAYVAGDAHELLRIYRTPQGLHPYFPRGCYQFSDPVGGRFDGPSWSPDGTKLAFTQGDGVHVAEIPPLTADPCDQGATLGRLLIPGARSADWGPADVPSARPVEQPRPNPEPPRVETPRRGGSGRPGANGVRLTRAPRTAKALAGGGAAVTVTCAKRCRVSATLVADGRLARALKLRGTRRLGAATARHGAKGAKLLTVRVDRRLRARLAKASGATVTLRVAGAGTTRSFPLRLR